MRLWDEDLHRGVRQAPSILSTWYMLQDNKFAGRSLYHFGLG